MSMAAGILAGYLNRIGMGNPEDAAQQFQLALLRQWCDHLEAVLDGNGIDRATSAAIIRQMVYGGTPGAAEAELRIRTTDDYMKLLQGNANPVWRKPGE